MLFFSNLALLLINYIFNMKRLIISVLMLMAATLIFSQKNSETSKAKTQQDLVVLEQPAL